MVRAILEGRKSQTRRIIAFREFTASDTPGYDWTFRDHRCLWHDYKADRFIREKCPYGTVGDRLWVRETWRIWDGPRVGGRLYAGCEPWDPDIVTGSIKSATLTQLQWLKSRHIEYRASSSDSDGPWRPSIFMPRWASRITLEITDVRVQRLQVISEGDAIAEGWEPSADGNPGNGGPCDWFRALWDSINGKRPGCAWGDNPWVWAVSFRPIEVQS